MRIRILPFHNGAEERGGFTMMKTFYFCACFICCSLLYGGSRAFASHAAGAELIYEWVSPHTYRFYLKFYRDCGGIEESSATKLCYYSSCITQANSVDLRLMPLKPDGSPNGMEVNPSCDLYPSKCRGGTTPGFREIWYTAIVTLPMACDSWTFYTTISARNNNNNITSISSLYVEAKINNLDAQDQSSPWFSVKPVPYVCANTPYRLNSGAIDPNNDSLSFEFIYPRILSSTTCATSYTATNIPFNAGFSLAEPFATGNTFLFNPQTGQMNFTPTNVGANTVAMRVNKWRKGKIIGTVMRDIQIQVLGCNLQPPTLTLLPASFTGGTLQGQQAEGYVNQTLSFCYDINTSNLGGALVVSDNAALVTPGSSITYSGMRTEAVKGCYTWTPSCADTGLRILTVTVKDSTCRPPGISITQNFTIPVYIRSGTVHTEKHVICSGTELTLQSTGSNQVSWSALPGGSPVSSLSCTNCTNPVAKPELTTTYQALSDIGGCIFRDDIIVHVDNDSRNMDISPADPHVICASDTVQLDVDIRANPPLQRLSCGVTSVRPLTERDTVIVRPPATNIQTTPNRVSTPFAGSFNHSARHQYLLRARDMKASGMLSGTISSLAFRISSITTAGIYDSIRISIGCTDRDVMEADSGFIPGTVLVYQSSAPLHVLTAHGYINFEFDSLYHWDTTMNLVVEVCYKNAATAANVNTHYFNNNYQSTLYSYSTGGSACDNSALPVFSTYETPVIRLGYYLAPDAAFSVRWKGTQFFPSDTIRNPAVFIQGVTGLEVEARTRYGCVLQDSLHVYFAPPFSLTRDTSICFGNSLQLHADSGSGFRWFENGFNPPKTLSCDECPDPVATPAENISYTVSGLNIYDCPDTVTMHVEVRPLPEVKILNSDTMINYGEEFQLVGSGAIRYSWLPISGLRFPNNAITMASPVENTVYILVGETDGCYAYDTIKVDVSVISKLFIPNAFSPNGDGRNDLFRVGNVRFEKVLEFRVFNRWGQEVYGSEYGNTGWDGTRDGMVQESGAYQYMILIGYPDGKQKLFKGSVILVR